MYLLARISIVPLSLYLTNVLAGKTHSYLALCYSLLSDLALLVTLMCSGIRILSNNLVVDSLGSLFAALVPILISRTYCDLSVDLGSEQQAFGSPAILFTDDLKVRRGSSPDEPDIPAFWIITRYTSLLAAVLLIPAVILCGEPGSIIRNCYLLDVNAFLAILLGSCMASLGLLFFTIVLVNATSPLTTAFLFVPSSAFHLLLVNGSTLSVDSLASLLICLWCCLGYLVSRRKELLSSSLDCGRYATFVLRRTIGVLVLIAIVPAVFQQYPSAKVRLGDQNRNRPTIRYNSPSNAHANYINRPDNSVGAKDDYLGTRPHIDMVANSSLLVDKCRGFYARSDRDHNGLECLRYLAKYESEYYFLPADGHGTRASEQDPRTAEFTDADGQRSSEPQYPSWKSAKSPSIDNIGSCAGPIIPYHIFWVGKASWRIELYVKSYLYTQNIPCSRVWLWVDTDANPHSLEDMYNDPKFVLFHPLIKRGDIVLKKWNYPDRVPIPTEAAISDSARYYQTPGNADENGTSAVADNIVEDVNGQRWLTFSPKYKPFKLDYISDVARFVILHLHGGVWCDIDVLLLRDLRPLLLPDPTSGQHAFAEQWVERSHPADYNSAVLSYSANSSLSSFLLHGGVRMGVNFCPKVIGRMAWKEGRSGELAMLDTAAFDPSTPTMNQAGPRECSVPCHLSYSDVFSGRPEAVIAEWRGFEGGRLKEENLTALGEAKLLAYEARGRGPASDLAGVLNYVVDKDLYPPNNRTMENFFRGAWGYHIHGQVSLQVLVIGSPADISHTVGKPP